MNNNGRWYIVTTIFNKLGLSELSNEYDCLNRLINFRKDVLENDEKYSEVLEQYDIVGPAISEILKQDEQTCKLLIQTYLTIILDLIRSKKYDEALELYIHMVNYLIDKYDIDVKSLCKRNSK